MRSSSWTWALAVAVLFPLSGMAQTLFNYDFTGAPGNQVSTPASGVSAGVLASVLDRGPGVTAGAGANSISSSNWAVGALDLTKYYQFTVTPDGGTVDVDSIVFVERRSGTGIRDIAIRSSQDGFTADLFTANVPDDTLTRQHTANLGAAFDGLAGPVTFRIYGFNAEAAAGTWRLGTSGGADNPNNFPPIMLINGNVSAVPEPATMLLSGLGLGGTVLAYKRCARRRRIKVRNKECTKQGTNA